LLARPDDSALPNIEPRVWATNSGQKQPRPLPFLATLYALPQSTPRTLNSARASSSAPKKLLSPYKHWMCLANSTSGRLDLPSVINLGSRAFSLVSRWCRNTTLSSPERLVRLSSDELISVLGFCQGNYYSSCHYVYTITILHSWLAKVAKYCASNSLEYSFTILSQEWCRPWTLLPLQVLEIPKSIGFSKHGIATRLYLACQIVLSPLVGVWVVHTALKHGITRSCSRPNGSATTGRVILDD
jgi:hypothetical protein